jgi:hypothetical protein
MNSCGGVLRIDTKKDIPAPFGLLHYLENHIRCERRPLKGGNLSSGLV